MLHILCSAYLISEVSSILGDPAITCFKNTIYGNKQMNLSIRGKAAFSSRETCQSGEKYCMVLNMYRRGAEYCFYCIIVIHLFFLSLSGSSNRFDIKLGCANFRNIPSTHCEESSEGRYHWSNCYFLGNDSNTYLRCDCLDPRWGRERKIESS